MKLTYDKEADAAYITIAPSIAPGQAAQQVGFIETPNKESQISLDFDDEGHLLGVEIIFAARALAPEALASAEVF
jgi:uncharacterized protein YuzE